MLLHHRRQFPVGQGFFHAATISFGEKDFNYIYDCGSLDQYTLLKSLSDYLNNMSNVKIDALFISHLHEDHVNGIDKLAANINIDMVVLPYLTPAQKILLIAQASDDGALSVDYYNLITDPPLWFSQKGVREVILIKNQKTTQYEKVSPSEINPQSSYQQTKSLKLSYRGGRRLKLKTKNEKQCPVIVLPDSTPLYISADNKPLNWIFLPYVHPDSDWELKFNRMFKENFGKSINDKAMGDSEFKKWLLDLLRRPESRNVLIGLYRIVSNDKINRTSMMLYSGPSNTPKNIEGISEYIDSDYKNRYDYHINKCGWLGTGDADLKPLYRQNAFENRYRKIFNLVKVFCLPHHGSMHNLNLSMGFPEGCYHVASAGAGNRFHHPHINTKAWVHKVHGEFILVSQHDNSCFDEKYIIC